MRRMRTIQVTRFGGPEVLEPRQAPSPVLRPGQALIAVEVADVLHVDGVIRAGAAEGWFDVQPPYVLGSGVAGRVIEVADRVDARWVGRRVVARTGSTGAAAELAAAPTHALVPVPDELSTADAAALVHDGLTAAALAEAARPRPGARVLVTAAAGAMGILLVQLLLDAGARVVGAVRGREKAEVIRDLGADAVDYGAHGWADAAVERAGGRFDVTLDGAGGAVGREAFLITADGGVFSAHGGPGGAFAPVTADAAAERGITLRGIRDLWLAPEEAGRLTAFALAGAAAGRLRPAIVRPLPLARAVDAHRVIDERRMAGKALLLVDPPADLRPSVAVAARVLAWPGTDAGWGVRGEHGLRLGGEELGHLHGDRVAHFGFPRDVGAALRAEGRVEPHPVNRHSPKLAGHRLDRHGDVDAVVALMRLNYDRVAARERREAA